jgi:hypothetical protein
MLPCTPTRLRRSIIRPLTEQLVRAYAPSSTTTDDLSQCTAVTCLNPRQSGAQANCSGVPARQRHG